MAVLFSTIAVMVIGLTEAANDMCGFNPLCTCRRTHHDVICRGVPFSVFPSFPMDGIYQVTLIRSGLEVLHHNFLQESNIASLHLMQNSIIHISPKAFNGLENILTTLDLSHNKLDASSLNSLLHLKNLQWLNLKGNNIEDFHSSHWSQMAFKKDLNSLFLSSNHITYISEGAFDFFINLSLLDIEGNLIHDIDSYSFPVKLASLSLSNNILNKLPLHAIYNLKRLRYLYLAGNLFRKLPCPFHLHTTRLEKLELGNNMLTQIPECVFNGSFTVKELHLDFNFIRILSPRCFKGTSLERLVLANNRIDAMHSDVFVGIERTLKTLDLSFNLIEEFPSAISNLNSLLYLSLKSNLLRELQVDDMQGCRGTLEVLDLSGNMLTRVPQLPLRHMKKLVRLSLQDNNIQEINQDDFKQWGEILTTLSLANNGITFLSERAFSHLKKLKELKLSFNSILFLMPNVFEPLHRTLEVLDLSSSIRFQNQSIGTLLKTLKKLEWVQLDHNNISKMSDSSIINLSKMRHLDFSNNNIREIPIDFFSGSTHSYLSTVNLGGNELKIIKSGNFWEIPYVSTLVLFDNKISVIEDYAFAHCPYLHTIVLSRNNLTSVASSSFYNLTRLSNLFLQDNSLEIFSLNAIEGDTSHLYINLSNNALKEVKTDENVSNHSVNVRTLDLTNNQLSVISDEFVTSISKCIMYLFLSKNQFENISFSELPLLQVLDLSCNRLYSVSMYNLECCASVQILMLSHNNISFIEEGAFSYMQKLRLLDLSNNKLVTISENLFAQTNLERLNLSGNSILVLPNLNVKQVHATLRSLDISFNKLVDLPSSNLTHLNKLQALNLSSNNIESLEGDSFQSLSHLLELDLSHNPLQNMTNENVFTPLFNLRTLKLCNSSLSAIGTLPLPNLRSLYLRNNLLSNISQRVLQNSEELRHLDISGNILQDFPLHLWSKTRHLNNLDISGNPIEVLGANSFAGLYKLQSLDISGLQLKRLDPRTLYGLRFLTSLKTDSYSSVRSFRLQDLISHSPALKRMSIHIEESTLSHQVQRAFGTKLRELVITGHHLRRILPDAFAGLVTHELVIRISGTLVSEFPDGLLKYLPDVRYLTLDLRNNRMATMGPGVLAAVTRNGPDTRQTQHITGGVLLEENPWACSCELLWLGRWLKRWLRETFHVHMLSVEGALYVNSVTRKAICSIPSTNTSIAIIDLKKSDIVCGTAVSGAANALFSNLMAAFSVVCLLCALC